MMEDATPIYQLQQNNAQPQAMIQDSRKEPLDMMSYTDILKNMSESANTVAAPKPIQQPQQVPQNTQQSTQPHKYPVMMTPPQQQSMHVPSEGGFPGLAYHPQHGKMSQQPPLVPPKASDDVTFQNEMLALLGVYIMVHTSQFQNTLQLKVPGIFNENGSPSVVGTLVNGVLVIVLWNIFKKFLLKYMKDI